MNANSDTRQDARLMIIVAVHDSAVDAYNRPTFFRSEQEAIRAFRAEVNRDDPSNTLFLNSADFRLDLLGYWNDANALFSTGTPDGPVISTLARAVDLREND